MGKWKPKWWEEMISLLLVVIVLGLMCYTAYKLIYSFLMGVAKIAM